MRTGPTHFYDFTREHPTDDYLNQDITVEYSITDFVPAQTYGPAEHCYPAEGAEVEIIRAWVSWSGADVELSDDEAEALAGKIALAHNFSGGGI